MSFGVVCDFSDLSWRILVDFGNFCVMGDRRGGEDVPLSLATCRSRRPCGPCPPSSSPPLDWRCPVLQSSAPLPFSSTGVDEWRKALEHCANPSSLITRSLFYKGQSDFQRVLSLNILAKIKYVVLSVPYILLNSVLSDNIELVGTFPDQFTVISSQCLLILDMMTSLVPYFFGRVD